MPLLLRGPARITILITDRNLTVIGDPIDGWTEVDITLRFNEPATGTFTAPRTAVSAAQLAPGNRVVVIRDGVVFCAGPIEEPGPEDWAVTGSAAGPGTVEVQFADDLAAVVARVTYPNPAAAATAQTSTARWTATDEAGDIMRSLVNGNAGPGALPARRVPQLLLGSGAGLGASIKVGTRFEPLGDVLRSAAIAGGGLGMRTRHDIASNQLLFDVYAAQDLSGSVRFSPGLNNLRSYRYEPAAPTATVAIVGGKDVGTSRVIVERVNATAATGWGRMETFVDQRQSTDTAADTTELNQAGDEALTRGAETGRLSSVTVDTPDQRYGVHYQLGDRVSVELASGVTVTDVVRAVHLQATPDAGEIVTALVGTQEASSDQAWLTYLRELSRRLDQLETV
ncbi:virus ReqiPepy6 Gp37-like protein [Micromonospora sediminicola]|uniref:Virus ReqiPepy6 Gp37-like protein n=1 Tax=Micromonospora sediminicola TaxID=946078 RepID=A0A1A9B338_9ACTN|nr:siphovirus ReqiPepy6 Gp37-like family protein [Micromonospora sediminicola]SBT63920.1 virus ReqiPepy6 Gp37-like protein [Micromonospora sediminicola]